MWQAGDVMRERASTMSDYQTEQSAQGRIQAWGAAMNMIVSHPITGVGLSAFVPAFPYYSDNHPREAHNTFFQIAGESGIIAGAMYLAIIGSCLLGIWRNGERLRQVAAENSGSLPFEYWLNEAILVGFGGLVVCSMFLSLQLFEVFYIFCVMINAMLFASGGKAADSLGIVK
jgi:O-antigen ligase